MRPNLITRLKEEWNNLDPVDPLRGLIADAIDALAEQPAQQQEFVAWQPIETAPKKEVEILLRSFSGLIAEGYFLRAAYNGVGGWVWPYIHQNPVHWMPLPPPPVEAAHGITGEQK